MPARTCGWCGVVAYMRRVHEVVRFTPPGRDDVLITAAFACTSCQKLSVAAMELEGTSAYNDAELFDAYPMLVEWCPQKGVGREFPDVPSHIAETASEVHQCLSIGACRASVLLARSVVEATAKAKGITDGNLFSKIDKLADEGLIRQLVKEQAHEVRLLGNDMAHGDFVEPISPEEAEEIVGLMAEVLREVFQAPAMLDRLRARRQATAES